MRKFKWWHFLVPLIWMIVGSIIFKRFGPESSICDQFAPHYYNSISAKVVKHGYRTIGGRPVGCLDLICGNGKSCHFEWFHEFKVYNDIAIGDSVSKPASSTAFEFYRSGKLLGVADWQCMPPEQ